MWASGLSPQIRLAIWALASFSGYVVADELYEGPYCVLSVVNNRQYKRILYEALDHYPTHDDITAFLRRLKTMLTDRHLARHDRWRGVLGECRGGTLQGVARQAFILSTRCRYDMIGW